MVLCIAPSLSGPRTLAAGSTAGCAVQRARGVRRAPAPLRAAPAAARLRDPHLREVRGTETIHGCEQCMAMRFHNAFAQHQVTCNFVSDTLRIGPPPGGHDLSKLMSILCIRMIALHKCNNFRGPLKCSTAQSCSAAPGTTKLNTISCSFAGQASVCVFDYCKNGTHIFRFYFAMILASFCKILGSCPKA